MQPVQSQPTMTRLAQSHLTTREFSMQLEQSQTTMTQCVQSKLAKQCMVMQ